MHGPCFIAGTAHWPSRVMPYRGFDKIFVDNGQGLQISHIDNKRVDTNNGKLELDNVLVIPHLIMNLFFC